MSHNENFELREKKGCQFPPFENIGMKLDY